MISDTYSIVAGIMLLALGTYLFRLAGPLLSRYFEFSNSLKSLLSEASTVLLFAVAISVTFYENGAYSGNARVIGVIVASVLAYRKMPFITIVLSAATTTALLRFLGVE